MNPVLVVSKLTAGYGHVEVVHGLDLHVEAGEIVALLGPNGAGKTTTLLAIAGAIPSRGQVELAGRPAPATLLGRTRRGLAFLPDQRGVIRALTVEQNLRLAGLPPAVAYQISPELQVLKNRRAADLSGGEQQILAITRAIASGPELLLADELSFGLGPIIITRMFDLLRKAAEQGAGILLVEQYARRALQIADRAYILQRGTVAVGGQAAELLADIDILERSYLGAVAKPTLPD